MKTQLSLTMRGAEAEFSVVDVVQERFGTTYRLVDQLAKHYNIEAPPTKKGAKAAVPELPIVGIVMRRAPYNGVQRTEVELIGRESMSPVERFVEATTGPSQGRLLANTALVTDAQGQRVLVDENGKPTTDVSTGQPQFEARTPDQVRLARLLDPWAERFAETVRLDEAAVKHLAARIQTSGGRRLQVMGNQKTEIEDEEEGIA